MINETWIFLDRFSKITEISNFMKIPPVGGSCSTRTERQTGRHDKAECLFRYSAKTPKNPMYQNMDQCQQTRVLSRLQNVQTGKSKCALGVLSPGQKWPRHKAGHSFPSNTQINNKCSHKSKPSIRLHSGIGTNLCIRATAIFTLDFLLYLHISHSSYHSVSTELLITFHQTRLRVSTNPWSSSDQ